MVELRVTESSLNRSHVRKATFRVLAGQHAFRREEKVHRTHWHLGPGQEKPRV